MLNPMFRVYFLPDMGKQNSIQSSDNGKKSNFQLAMGFVGECNNYTEECVKIGTKSIYSKTVVLNLLFTMNPL